MLAFKTAKYLVDKAVEAGDIYSAAAVYQIANIEQRVLLESIMFGKRRDALVLARWEYTPAEVLNAICIHCLGDAAIALRLDRNQNTPAVAISELYDVERRSNNSLTVLIAQHQHTPNKVLEAIVEFSNDIESLKAVSKNPAANTHVLRLLLNRMVNSEMNKVIVKNVAANPSTSGDLLASIYEKGDTTTRVVVLGHVNCPLFLIDLAMTNISSAPLEIQRQLAKDNRLNIEALSYLSVSHDKAVRCGIAANLASPSVIVKRLLNDESHLVKRALATRADLSTASIKRLMIDKDHWVRQWLARNLMVSRKVLESFTTDSHADVRRAVARNKRCSTRLLAVLANDENAWVRSAVAYQKNATKRLLEVLANDADVDVLSGVANNSRTPQWILQKFIASPEADIRRAVILNRKAQRKTLLPLLEDSYYLHRLILVSSAKLKESDKWLLCNDPDFQVRFTAFHYFAKSL